MTDELCVGIFPCRWTRSIVVVTFDTEHVVVQEGPHGRDGHRKVKSVRSAAGGERVDDLLTAHGAVVGTGDEHRLAILAVGKLLLAPGGVDVAEDSLRLPIVAVRRKAQVARIMHGALDKIAATLG